MPTTGTGMPRARSALEGFFDAGDTPSSSNFDDFIASFFHPSEDVLAASIITSGTFDNARINFAAPAAIGGGTPAAGTFTAIVGSSLIVAADAFRVTTAKTPASAGAAGTQGDICWDANFVYVCVSASTWKRAALSTW